MNDEEIYKHNQPTNSGGNQIPPSFILMASFRRTLSMPVTQPGYSLNDETHAMAASSLSKSSSSNSDHPPIVSLFPRSFSSLDYRLCKVQTFVFSFLPKRFSRPFERMKSKGNIWRRALFHFFAFFLAGVFVGCTPFASPTFSMNFITKNQAFSFEKLHQVDRVVLQHTSPGNRISSKPKDFNHGTILVSPLSNESIDDHHQYASLSFSKLLIVVTPIYGRPFEAYYIIRLANTLKLAHPPLLWIIVEMVSQSLDIAELLRSSGVMFRHLICKENQADMNDVGMHLRNVALSHIETHKLDGIIYFANYENIYTIDLFDQMRQIRRLGTWTVAKVEKEETNVMMEGPICNGTKIIGWHTNHDVTNKFKRFHTGLSGFAFNSSILWDPKRWHRPTPKPIRFLHTVKEVFQVSMFIGQIVEDESQMEGFPLDCSRIMVWHVNMESLHSFLPRKSNLLPYWFDNMKMLPQ